MTRAEQWDALRKRVVHDLLDMEILCETDDPHGEGAWRLVHLAHEAVDAADLCTIGKDGKRRGFTAEGSDDSDAPRSEP